MKLGDGDGALDLKSKAVYVYYAIFCIYYTTANVEMMTEEAICKN